MNTYILNGHTPIPEPDVMKWSRWFENADRRVAKTELEVSIGDKKLGLVTISTVFLGIDHSFGIGRPLLFESMIFGGEHDQDMDRCSTWDEAVKMHEKMIERAKT